MFKFLGEPFRLVRFNPPLGNLHYVRFDENGEFVTDNERIIKRFSSKYDSVPTTDAPTPELSDDDLQLERHQEETKQYPCKKCDFVADGRGPLMAHYRADHPKEE